MTRPDLRVIEGGLSREPVVEHHTQEPLPEQGEMPFAVVDEITGMRQRAQEYEDNPDLVRGIIAEGCEKAREVASQTLDDVKQAMGLAYR